MGSFHKSLHYCSDNIHINVLIRMSTRYDENNDDDGDDGDDRTRNAKNHIGFHLHQETGQG